MRRLRNKLPIIKKMSTGKKAKALIEEERKPLVRKTPEKIVPGSSRGAVPSEGTSKSYESTSVGEGKKAAVKDEPSTPRDASASSKDPSSTSNPSGYQSTPGPSSSKSPPEPATKSSVPRQIFLGSVIALPSVPCGMSLGFSAISLDALGLSVDAASWYASITIMSYPIGCLLVGNLMDQFGRKPALISITVVSLIGWLMLSVPSSGISLTKLMIGRFLTGVAGGLASVPAAVYAAECLCANNVKIRSSLVTWSTVALSLGIFLTYAAGAFLTFYNVASIATLISIVSLVLVTIFIPESPSWLSSKGRHGDAEWSERELNIAPPPQHQEDPSASEWEDSTASPAPALPPPEAATIQELSKPEVYKPLLIMIGFLFFQQFSGVYVVIAYMVDIIRAAGVVTVDPYWLSIVCGAVILGVSIAASIIYPRTGVRAIAAISGAGTSITMFAIGFYLSLRYIWISNSNFYFLNWIPVFIVISNIALSTAGFLILPWSMLGEVFPITVKGIAAGLATCAGFIFSFAVLKLYPYIQLGFGVAEVFYFFGAMALLGTIFVLAYLPETHGKTLQEIMDEFRKRGKKSGKVIDKNPSSVKEAEVKV